MVVEYIPCLPGLRRPLSLPDPVFHEQYHRLQTLVGLKKNFFDKGDCVQHLLSRPICPNSMLRSEISALELSWMMGEKARALAMMLASDRP